MAFDANDLTPHEHFVVERTRLGEVADFTPMAGPGGGKPEVRAGFLRKLLLGLDPAWSVAKPGVRIKAARIEGMLDLSDCGGDSGLPALSLEECVIAEPINVSHARLARLSLRQSVISTLDARGLVLAGPLDITGVGPVGAEAAAWISASGAQIGGDVTAAGAKLIAPAPRAPAEVPRGQRRYALHLRNAVIGGSIFLVDGFAAQGGVNLDAARVGGGLNCRDAALAAGEGAALRAHGACFGGPLLLTDGFLASGEVRLEGVEVGGDVCLSQARFEGAATAIDLSGAKVRGAVIGPLKAEGGLMFAGADVAANLDLRGVEISYRKLTAVAQYEHAIDATNVRVGGALLLQGANIKGEVLLAGARVEGYVAFGGGRFINAGAWAIRAPNLRAGGNLTFKISENGYAPHGQKTVIEGGAKFDRARIDGALAWLNLELRGPGPEGAKGAVFSFSDAAIEGPLQARALTCQQDARIDASGASCAALDDDVKAGWGLEGAALDLDGFDYGRIDGAEEHWRQRLGWLRRARGPGQRFSPQPFAHAAQVYGRAGRREDARRILLAQHDLGVRATPAGPLTWLLSSLFGLIAGYGLAPLRVARALVLFLALGVVGVAAMDAQGALVTPAGLACGGAVEPALYAIDVALPVVDLGQESRCAPGRTVRADLPAGIELSPQSDWRLFEGVALWRWAHALYALVGAVLTALAVLTFSGVMKPRDQ